MSNVLLDLTSDYSLRWRNFNEDILLCTYNQASQSLVSSGREDLLLIESDGNEMAFVLKDNYVLFMDSSGLVSAGQFSDRYRPNVYPRVDFVRELTDKPQTIASLSLDGRLTVPGLFELDVPASQDRMTFFGNIAFTPLGLYAVSIAEINLSIDGDDYSVIGNNDLLLI
jgi:hypothetical protein